MEDKKEILQSLKYAKTVTVNEVEYTLQKLPIRPALEIRQRCTEDGYLNDIKMYEAMLESVVISPKKKLDDFEDVGDLEELMKEVFKYQYKGK